MTAPEPDAAGAPAPTIREVFDRERERLAREWEAKHDSEAYLRAHTSVLDTAVLAMLAESGLPADRIAVAAVGGYGRGELYPYSDIDLLVLTDESVKEDESCQTALATFTTRLWELGLTVGASVRSTSEFLSEAAEDVSIATTYLESRCLWGNGRLYAQARMHFAQTLDPRRFFRDKMLELARRHQKFEDTPYSLEPNIKESPGGLRDLQVAKASGALLDVGLERIGRVLELLMASGKFKHLVAEEAPGVKRLREVHSRLGVESAVAPEAAAFEIRGRY